LELGEKLEDVKTKKKKIKKPCIVDKFNTKETNSNQFLINFDLAQNKNNKLFNDNKTYNLQLF
jgi:hypothetical protein